MIKQDTSTDLIPLQMSYSLFLISSSFSIYFERLHPIDRNDSNIVERQKEHYILL